MKFVNDWIIVPGGPGLSFNYLKPYLSAAITNQNLLYYHPYGSTHSNHSEPTLAELVTQIQEVANENKLESYGLITHSFGNYLAMRAIEQDYPIKAIIMLNPIPFKYQLWKQAIQSIVNKIPVEHLTKIQELTFQQQDSEVFKLIYPFYVGNQESSLNIEVAFNLSACNKISDQINNFDDTNLIRNSRIPFTRIVGELDPFYIEKDTLTEKTLVLPHLGHYPFIEDSNLFKNEIQNIF